MDSLVDDAAAFALAVSDDLTGAAACAGEVLSGRTTTVVVQALDKAPPGVRIVVLDTNTRTAEATRAAAALAGVGAAPATSDIRYKRIDSALRGNIRSELGSLIGADARLVVAAASPALGVTTRNSQQLLAGQPISRTWHGTGPEAPNSGSLLDHLPVAGVSIPLGAVRSPDLHERLRSELARRRAVVLDGETNDDLARAAQAAHGIGGNMWFVGSYGFLRALGKERGLVATMDPPSPDTISSNKGQGVLIIVGSRHPASQLQVARLPPGTVEGVCDPATSRRVAKRLGRGEVVALISDAAALPGQNPSLALAALAVSCAEQCLPNAVVIVGGELASALFAASSTSFLSVHRELWPTVPLAEFHGGALDGVPAIFKSGAQGEANWLEGAVHFSVGKERR
jgi:D-threonate/D-erythronate kinase